MRVVPGAASGQSVATTKSVPNGSSASFQVSQEANEASNETRAPSGAVATIGLTAVLALQSEGETPLQRRRRQLKRGFSILDALDALKIELLSGRVQKPTLERISAAMAEIPASDLDPHAKALMRDIEVRAAVELAKYGI